MLLYKINHDTVKLNKLEGLHSYSIDNDIINILIQIY